MIAHPTQKGKAAPRIGVAFAALPLDVASRSDITPLAKVVFAVVSNHARIRRGDASTMTNAQIAKACGVSVPGIRRAVAELVSKGLFVACYRDEAKRIRDAIQVTYTAAEVDASTSTQRASTVESEQPGCCSGIQGVDARTTTPLSTKNEEPERTGSLALDSGEKTPDPDDRIATPQEAAEFMRALIRGGKPTLPDTTADEPKVVANCGTPAPRPATTPRPTPTPLPSPTSIRMPTLPGSGGVPNVARMAYEVAFSARAAAFRPIAPRKTAAQQMNELKRFTAGLGV
jgi:hypothetical protein